MATSFGLGATCVRLTRLASILIAGASNAAASPVSHQSIYGTSPLWKRDDTEPLTLKEFYVKGLLSCLLVLLGGVFSGLTLGLMGLDMVNLQVLSESGASPRIQKDARTVLSLLQKGRHWVLCCLLMSNVVVNETLPIFLDEIMPGGGFLAVASSSVLIVIFGEVIPQALCSRHGLRLGAMAAPYVAALMYAEAPIAYPVARLLDRMIGESHGVVYKKAELRTFVSLHGHIGHAGESLRPEEVTIIGSVLELADKEVSDIMTPLEDAYVLPSDTILDEAKVNEIIALGHSRIPIYTPGHFGKFEGMLLVKKLAAYDPAQARPVSSFRLNILPEVARDATCFDALNYFEQGRAHLLLVSNTPGVEGGAIGIVSLEDVIEELLSTEIVDEDDVYVDNHKKDKVVRTVTPSKVASSRVSLSMGPLFQSALDFRTRKRSGSVSSSYSSAAGFEPKHAHRLSHSHHASTSSSIPLSTFPPQPTSASSTHSRALSNSTNKNLNPPPPPSASNRVAQKTTPVAGKQFVYPSPVMEVIEDPHFALGRAEDDDDDDGELENEVRRMVKGEKRLRDEEMLMSMNSPEEKNGWS